MSEMEVIWIILDCWPNPRFSLYDEMSKSDTLLKYPLLFPALLLKCLPLLRPKSLYFSGIGGRVTPSGRLGRGSINFLLSVSPWLKEQLSPNGHSFPSNQYLHG